MTSGFHWSLPRRGSFSPRAKLHLLSLYACEHGVKTSSFSFHDSPQSGLKRWSDFSLQEESRKEKKQHGIVFKKKKKKEKKKHTANLYISALNAFGSHTCFHLFDCVMLHVENKARSPRRLHQVWPHNCTRFLLKSPQIVSFLYFTRMAR